MCCGESNPTRICSLAYTTTYLHSSCRLQFKTNIEPHLYILNTHLYYIPSMTMTSLNQIANEIQPHLPFNIQYVLASLPNPPTRGQPIMTNRAPTY
jgi:hypothetical protein